MKENIFITGANGMDGSLLIDFLLKEFPDINIYGGIRHSTKVDLSNLSEALKNDRFKVVPYDSTDPISINNVILSIKPKYFVNFAANSFVGNSWDYPVQHFDINATSVIHILESIRKHSPETRFYQASSSEMFGDVEYHPQDEKHPLKPRSPYGASKCAAHLLVKVYRESYGLYAVSGICFNHEGIRRNEVFVTRKITKKVAEISKKIQNNEKFEPLRVGNIYSKRDWSDADDIIVGIWKMLNQDQYSNWLLNGGLLSLKDYVLSSGETHSIKEFIELAFKYVSIDGTWIGEGINEKLVSKQGKILVEIDDKFFRPCEVDLLYGDSSSIRNDLKWEPKVSFNQLVKKMVDNDLQNDFK